MRDACTPCMFILVGLVTSIVNAETASGPGGSIPCSPGIWGSSLPPLAFASSVELQQVASVESITLTGIQHTWVGDIHVALFDPNGTGYNILVRPGFTGAGFGSSADLNGDYILVEPGSAPPFPTSGTFVQPGTYSQYVGLWPSGVASLFSTPLSGISGSSGSWTLKIFDWGGADIGSLGGWTIEYEVPAPGVAALIALAAATAIDPRRRRA